MTLPASGAISLNQIADEFSLAHNSVFPTAYYGKGGAPSSGVLTFTNFYGLSAFSLSAPRTSISASGYSATDSVVITSTVDTTFSFTGTTTRATATQTDSKHATVSVNTPGSGNGSASGTVRATATNGDFLDISYTADWGSA